MPKVQTKTDQELLGQAILGRREREKQNTQAKPELALSI